MGKTYAIEERANLAVWSVPGGMPKVISLFVGIEASSRGRPVIVAADEIQAFGAAIDLQKVGEGVAVLLQHKEGIGVVFKQCLAAVDVSQLPIVNPVAEVNVLRPAGPLQRHKEVVDVEGVSIGVRLELEDGISPAKSATVPGIVAGQNVGAFAREDVEGVSVGEAVVAHELDHPALQQLRILELDDQPVGLALHSLFRVLEVWVLGAVVAEEQVLHHPVGQ